MTDPVKSGRGWAWVGFLLGIGASVAANVSHSYIVQTALGGTNIIGPLISAAFWPLALFLCLEVMSRVMWPKGWQWWLVRYIGLSLVATIAAVVSWRHMHGLLNKYGEDGFVAVIGPIAVDGLMIVCSSALLAVGHNLKQRALAHHESKTEATTPPVSAESGALPEYGVRTPYPTSSEPVVEPVLADVRKNLPKDLLEAARTAQAAYRLEHDGRPITRDALRTALGISTRRASELLRELRANP